MELRLKNDKFDCSQSNILKEYFGHFSGLCYWTHAEHVVLWLGLWCCQCHWFSERKPLGKKSKISCWAFIKSF